MVREICISKLNEMAKTYKTRIWIAKRMGRRWSYIVGAGEESLLPAKLIVENKNYAIFIEGKSDHWREIKNEAKKILKLTNL